MTTAIYESDPKDGAVGVALNQALVVEGVFASSSIRLENERGEPVPFELNAGPWPGCPGTSADVLPRAPLAPNSQYVLRVDALYPDDLSLAQASSAIHFTTGSSSLAEITLEPPTASASVVRDAPEAMCGSASTVFACIGIEEGKDVELVMRKGQEILLRTTRLVQNDGVYSLPVVPDCVELRRRSPTGKRSAPLAICGAELGARAWTASDSPEQFVSCHGGVIGAPAPHSLVTNAADAGTEAPVVPDLASGSDPATDQTRASQQPPDGCTLSQGSAKSSAAPLLVLLAGLCAQVSARRRRNRKFAKHGVCRG